MTRLIRFPGWDVRLAELLEARVATPLVWGRHDCALLAADAVLATTGVDPAAELRGRYRSAAGAHRALAATLGLPGNLAREVDVLREFAEAFAARHGVPRVDRVRAKRGDVALILADRPVPWFVSVLGVVVSEGIVVADDPGYAVVNPGLASVFWGT